MAENANLNPGVIEMKYIAMGEILKTFEWWTLSAEEALEIAKKATRGRLPNNEIIDEFESLRELVVAGQRAAT